MAPPLGAGFSCRVGDRGLRALAEQGCGTVLRHLFLEGSRKTALHAFPSIRFLLFPTVWAVLPSLSFFSRLSGSCSLFLCFFP